MKSMYRTPQGETVIHALYEAHLAETGIQTEGTPRVSIHPDNHGDSNRVICRARAYSGRRSDEAAIDTGLRSNAERNSSSCSGFG